MTVPGSSQLTLSRVLLGMLAVAMPLVGVLWSDGGETFDPFPPRILFSFVAVVALATSWHWPRLTQPTLVGLGYGMTAWFLIVASVNNATIDNAIGLVPLVLVVPLVSDSLTAVAAYAAFVVMGTVLAYHPLTEPGFDRDVLLILLLGPALGLGWASATRTGLHRELEARVEQRTAALQHSLEQLQREVHDRSEAEVRARAANRAKSSFLANMSHELRTPLNAILGYGEMVAEVVEDPTASQDLEHIDTAARHLLRIIEDVLDLSRIEADTVSMHIQEVQLEPLVRDCLALITPAAEGKGLRLETDLRCIVVCADAVRLRQVLLNLLQNATRFTEVGGIVVRAREVEDGVAIDVEDTGVGISKTDRARVFERFAQVDDSSTRRHDGTGLGLAICRELTQRMDGHIELTSQSGVGSCFTVVLPAPSRHGELVELYPESLAATGSPSGS